MNECPKEIIDYIHDYLDGDLDAEKETVLQEYLSSCAACRAHFRELERTISFIQSTPSVQAPEGFTAGVFARLPKEKKTTRARGWFRYHPMLTAASVFLLLMVTSLVGSFGDTNEFSFTNYDNVIVEGNVVVVPEGEVVSGDIVVKNGEIRIEGQVDGDVTIINGERYLASAGDVTGEIEEIDQVFSWLWYHIKKTAFNVSSFFTGEDTGT